MCRHVGAGKVKGLFTSACELWSAQSYSFGALDRTAYQKPKFVEDKEDLDVHGEAMSGKSANKMAKLKAKKSEVFRRAWRCISR